MADASGALRAHFDARASTYAAGTPWAADPRSLEPIAHLVRRARARRLLEIGVGPGPVPDFLRRDGTLPAAYIGLDLSAAMLQHAEEWLPVQGYASNLPFRDGAFDLLLIRQAFHYFVDPPDVLLEVVRVLTDAGALLIAQITPFDDDADIEWWSRAVALRQPLRRQPWTAASLEQLVRSRGFSVEEAVRVVARSSLRNWLNRYPTDRAVAQELVSHYERAPAAIRHIRQFDVRPDGDIHFSIQWVILFGRRSYTEPRKFHVRQ